MKLVILLFASSFLFACTTTEYVYVKPKPYAFQKTPLVPSYAIRVHPNDAALYEEYIKTFRAHDDFHNKQIDDYMETFNADK